MAKRERVVGLTVKARDEFSPTYKKLEQAQNKVTAAAKAAGRRQAVGVAKDELQAAIAEYQRLTSEVDRYRAVQVTAARTGSLSATEMRELGETIKLVRDRSREAMTAIQQKRAALGNINTAAASTFVSFSRAASAIEGTSRATTRTAASTNAAAAGLKELDDRAKGAAISQKRLHDRVEEANDALARQGRSGSRAGSASDGPARIYGMRPDQLTNLSYQANDVISGLAMGQAPLQILAQQAGQIVQIWPEFMTAIARSAPQVAIFSAAMAPFLSAALRLKEAGDSVEYFNSRLSLSADGYRYTAEGLTEITTQIKAMGVSIGDARKLVSDFTAKGIDADQFSGLAELAKQLNDITGEGIVEAGDRLSDAFSGSADDVRELDKELNFLTASQYEQIRAMEAAGDKSGALALAQQVLAGRLNAAQTESSEWAGALEELGGAWDGFIKGIENSGIIQVVGDHIEDVGKGVKIILKDVSTLAKSAARVTIPSLDQQISDLEKTIARDSAFQADPSVAGSVISQRGNDALIEAERELIRLRRQRLELQKDDDAAVTAAGVAAVKAAEDKKKAESDIRDVISENLKTMEEEAKAVDLTNRERFIEERLLKARNEALEQAKTLNQEFLGLTKEQTEAIRQQAGALYDRQNPNYEAQYTAERGTPRGAQMEELISATVKLAEQMGLSAKDLLTAMSYETGGTFDPWKAGPTTQYGQHRGLIQWGEPQAAQYGVTGSSSISSQIEAVGKYLADAGVKAGDGLLQIYAAINAGNARNINASDANNGGAPGTVLDKVDGQMDGHKARADGLLAAYGGAVETATELAKLDKERLENEADYLEGYQKRVDQQKFELDLLSESARQAAIAKAVRDEENQAKEAGLTLTKEQRAETERLAAAEFDRQNVNLQVNQLMEQREALLDRMQLAQDAGDQSLLSSTSAELDGVNTKLKEAIAQAIAFWQAMGGEGSAAMIAGLQNANLQIDASVNRMRTQFLPTAEDINNRLADIGGNAFSAFAQAIANGENAADAFFNALLQGLAEFAIEIGKAIVKQALFNALTGGSAGGGAGGGIGGAILGLFGAKHTGGIVGERGMTRLVDPSVFVHAQKHHSGGVVGGGLKSNEVPIIALRNEEVLTEDDPRHVANGGGKQAVNLKNVNVFKAEDVLEAALSSVPGERILMNWLTRNANKAKGALDL